VGNYEQYRKSNLQSFHNIEEYGECADANARTTDTRDCTNIQSPRSSDNHTVQT
jgi:hypothetical protein